MKKFITIFSIFLFLSFSMNIITAVAAPKSFSQGFYSIKDLNLMANTPYSIQNISTSDDSFMIVFDSSQRIQQAIRLYSNSPKYVTVPFQYDYLIVIIGNGKLVFS